MRVVGSVEGCLLQRAQNLARDVYLAGGSDVSADFGDDDGFFAKAYGEVAGNAGVEFTHGVFLGFFEELAIP
jgi:hypothetical protein